MAPLEHCNGLLEHVVLRVLFKWRIDSTTWVRWVSTIVGYGGRFTSETVMGNWMEVDGVVVRLSHKVDTSAIAPVIDELGADAL